MAHKITGIPQPAISSIHEDKSFDEKLEIMDIVNSGIVEWEAVSIDNPNIFDLLEKVGGASLWFHFHGNIGMDDLDVGIGIVAKLVSKLLLAVAQIRTRRNQMRHVPGRCHRTERRHQITLCAHASAWI